MKKEDAIQLLQLEAHPLEGGFFRRTYESEISFEGKEGQRKLLTSIFYMLTTDGPISHLHRNKSDIIHYFHLGLPTKYILVSPEGEISEETMGSDIAAGQRLQLVVPGGYWKASELCISRHPASKNPDSKSPGSRTHAPAIKSDENDFSLISEAVSPGFEFEDNELAIPEQLANLSPNSRSRLNRYIKALS